MAAWRRLGEFEVSPIALGCMGMSGIYGAADENESIRTIHAAIDRGVTVLGTGDFYGMGHNEMLIGRGDPGTARENPALGEIRRDARTGRSWVGYDARPAAVKNFLSHTLTRLGVDHIDITGRPGGNPLRRAADGASGQ